MSPSPLLQEVRRVVTGVDANGRSRVMSDGGIERFSGPLLGMMWATDVGQSQIPGTQDAVPSITEIFAREGSTRLVATIMPPDSQRDFRARLTESAGDVVRPNTRDSDGWHTTESVDYLIVMAGEVVCELDEGEVTLRAGDVMVQTGTRHRWRNRTEQPALVYAVPVGVPFTRA